MERCIGGKACLKRNLIALEPVIDYIPIIYGLCLIVLFLNQTQKSPQNQMILRLYKILVTLIVQNSSHLLEDLKLLSDMLAA